LGIGYRYLYYNTGPGRIETWRRSSPLAADIWSENIAFYETREYFKNVLTYMAIYKQLLGESFNLSSIISSILP
jgi:soluble lytic murein transglycosylase